MNNIPTLNELYTQILSDLESSESINITIPLFGKNFLRALAMVQAAKMKLLYLRVGFVQKNIFVDTADSEAIGGTLERFGRVKLGRNPFPARAAEYTIEVVGTIGATIPASTVFRSDDDSLNPTKLYILDNAYTLTATTDTVIVRALEAGNDSQLLVGDTMTSTIPLANIEQVATVTIESVEPLAAETIEQYRRITIEAFRLEAQGGAGADYRLWAFDVQAVRQAYPYAKSGNANEVDLYIEATIADSTDGKGTPSGATLAAVESVIEDPTATRPARKPLTVFAVNYIAVTPLDVEVQIQGTNSPTTEQQATITTAIEEALNSVRPFVDSIDIEANRNDTIDLFKLGQIILNAIPAFPFTGIQLLVNTNVVTSYTFEDGEIPYLDDVIFS
jgi:uncharacterized phage protein gp47/JayE